MACEKCKQMIEEVKRLEQIFRTDYSHMEIKKRLQYKDGSLVPFPYEGETRMVHFLRRLIEELEKIQTRPSDVVEVVRCKDCIWSYRIDSREPKYDCRHICRTGCTQWLDSDDFCSYGERRA